MCKVYSGYCGTSEIEHGLCTCTVDNPLAKARGLSLRTGAQTMLYLPLDNSEIFDAQTWTPKQRCDQVLASSKHHLPIIIDPPYLCIPVISQ